MNEISHLFRQEKNREFFLESLARLEKGKGSVIAITGEMGLGKTHLLNDFHQTGRRKQQITSILVEAQPPVGNFNVGKLQPLHPFARAIETLLNEKKTSAHKKFAFNIGMTVLSTVPIAGDLFYAVKEFGKDWRQFKKDKSSESFKKVSSAAADFYDTISSYCNNKPLLLLIDDFHWADAQSIELLNMFTQKLDELPLMIVFSYQRSTVESQASPLFSYLKANIGNNPHFKQIELEHYSQSEIRDLCQPNFPGYLACDEFEKWIYERSLGVPGVAMEYIHYFKKYNPFNSDGTLNEDFHNNDYLPSTVQTAFSQVIEKLSEDDKNLLSICSAEGREFCVMVVSKLYNTDVLTMIKKLRSIQNTTGIISSGGARELYGVKTTVYRFTQAFYHSFFENQLEYEESIALHCQISELLKQKYAESENDMIRSRIAPFIAAHSSESGDNETARTMLISAAGSARDYGSQEIASDYYKAYSNLNHPEIGNSINDNSESEFKKIFNYIQYNENIPLEQNTTELNGSINTGNLGIQDPQTISYDESNYQDVTSEVISLYHNCKFEESARIAGNYLTKYANAMSLSGRIQMLAIVMRSEVEAEQLDKAEEHWINIEGLLETNNNVSIECLALNACAILRLHQNRMNDCYNLLQKAARLSFDLPEEMQLLTIANIGNYYSIIDPPKAIPYYETAKKIGTSLNFNVFVNDML